MTSKHDNVAELWTPEQPRNASAAPAPTVANAASASHIVFFDAPLAYAYGHGIGSVTLTSCRQLVDASGQVYEDRIVTALLRAPLQSLQNLKQVITAIEKLADDQAAAAMAAAREDAPAGRPH